jgi:hypothetical protein
MSLILTEFDHHGRCASHSIAHIERDAIADMAIEDRVDGNAPPRFVPQQGVDGLIAISDETFGRLSKAVGLDHRSLATTKSDLASGAEQQESDTRDCFGDFTETHTSEQAQVWLLSAMRSQLNVHWGALSDLYNTCEDEQKKAINDIFEGCFGFKLESLYAIKEPEIALPTELMPVIQVEQRSGMTWCFNENKGAWQREDANQSQFVIEGRANTMFDGHALISTASTFEEALALSTAYVRNLDQKPGFNRISITAHEYMGTSISKMLLDADIKRTTKPSEPYSAKLSWNLEKLQDKPLELTFKTIMQIEKCLGVRWAPANRLEHDLGM